MNEEDVMHLPPSDDTHVLHLPPIERPEVTAKAAKTLEIIREKKKELIKKDWDEAKKDEIKRRYDLTMEERRMEDWAIEMQKAEYEYDKWMERVRARYARLHEKMLVDWKSLWLDHEKLSDVSDEYQKFLSNTWHLMPRDIVDEASRFLPTKKKVHRVRFIHRIEPRLLEIFTGKHSEDKNIKSLIQDGKNLQELLGLDEIPIYIVGAIYGKNKNFKPTPEFFASLDVWREWAKKRGVPLDKLLARISLNEKGKAFIREKTKSTDKIFTPEDLVALRQDPMKPPEI